MHAAALHAHIAAVIDRQHRSLAQILAEFVFGAEAVDADDLHALVNAIDHCFSHVDLAHGSDQFGVLRMLIEVIGGSPGKIAGGLNLGSHIAHDVAGVLEADDRSERSCRVLFEELQRVFVSRPRHADRRDSRHRTGPGEIAVDHQVAVPHRAGQKIVDRDLGILEHDERV